MTREYFPSKFYLDNRTRYFLWSTEVDSEDDFDRDEVWTRDGITPTFATLAQLEQFAREEVGVRFPQEGEPLLHDLDYVARWLQRGKSKRVSYFRPRRTLDAWNIFSDLARSLHIPFAGDSSELTELWDMLLFGDPQKPRFPRWSGHQLQMCHDVLGEGLNLWRARSLNPTISLSRK